MFIMWLPYGVINYNNNYTRLPSQLESVTVPWSVSFHTAWWTEADTCVNDLPRVAAWLWNCRG